MDFSRSGMAGANIAGTNRQGHFVQLCAAALVYFIVTLVFTWPVARGLTRDVPSDLGDSLLNMWILTWDAEQFRRLLSGDFLVIARWFDANIFYPVPNSLAYSEHLIPQAIQILPVYLLTRNPILCYNLLFLSTYVLSAIGMYLLVRELTGDGRAAFVAGLIFGFIPYRIPQAAHLQVLCAQWMPFTLFAITRYLNRRRRSALAWAGVCFVLQGLSCGYYLIFFTPFLVTYVLWELRRRRLYDRAVSIHLGVTTLACVAALAPFLIPYARVQSNSDLTRRVEEVSYYSADIYAYFTAFPIQRFWGPRLQLWPHGEGELFMGAVAMLLALTGGVLQIVRAARSSGSAPAARRPLDWVLAATVAALVLLIVSALFAQRLSIDVGGMTLRINDIVRPMALLATATAVWLLLSRRARAGFQALDTVEFFFLLSIVVAWWLSLGPNPTSLGKPLDFPAPYRLLYALPGVNGLRVPARLAMIVALMLSVSAGFVIARLPRRRIAVLTIAIVIAAFLFEAPASEVPINGVSRTPGFGAPEERVYPPSAAPLVYRAVAGLRDEVVLLELPIGDPNWDVRAVYYSMSHWKPLVNGYSGFVPPHYGGLISRLSNHDRDPGAAEQALRESRATHVLVHDRGFSSSDAQSVHRWLESVGARTVAVDGGDTLYAILTP